MARNAEQKIFENHCCKAKDFNSLSKKYAFPVPSDDQVATLL
jgi:hypothetical protein